jgi:hypothetical protein
MDKVGSSYETVESALETRFVLNFVAMLAADDTGPREED